MKKLISLSIGCSLALAGAALAQQPVEQQSPSKNKHAPEKTHATEAQPKTNAAKPQAPAATQQHGAIKEQGATHEPGAMKEHGATTQHGATNEPGAMKEHGATNEPPRTNVSGEQVGGQTPNARQRIEEGRKGMRGPAAAKTSTNPAAPAAPAAAAAHEESANAPATGTDVSGQSTGMPTHRGKQQAEERKQGVKQPAAAAGAAPPASAAGQQNAQANAGARAKKPDPQQVQQIKSQHANFRAQPKPQQVPPVTFNQNHRIEGSDHWQGQQYETFRSYHSEWHDEGWYHSHYPNVTLIGGGYYFFNNGYWFPAWGYSPSAQYYAYDGPIYVGQRAEPPDKVIADVQAVLQQMGYYKGEVDGLLGPLSREALAAYQADQGLTQTAAIDEPTLDALGMS